MGSLRILQVSFRGGGNAASRLVFSLAFIFVLQACGGLPSTSIYRGVVPEEVTATMTLSQPRAMAMVQQFAGATMFDAGAGVDRKPPANVAWVDWRMPYDQHLRLERHEAGVWRLMTEPAPGKWQPWHYQPERTATFVAAGMWRDFSEPIAVVAYGSDVVFLVNKVWHMRRAAGAGQVGPTMGMIRRQADWADLDLSAVIDDPRNWKLLLDPVERALWVLPWRDNAVDVSRQGWRFALSFPSEVIFRMATRVRFAAGPAATAPAPSPAPSATPAPGGGGR